MLDSKIVMIFSAVAATGFVFSISAAKMFMSCSRVWKAVIVGRGLGTFGVMIPILGVRKSPNLVSVDIAVMFNVVER